MQNLSRRRGGMSKNDDRFLIPQLPVSPKYRCFVENDDGVDDDMNNIYHLIIDRYKIMFIFAVYFEIKSSTSCSINGKRKRIQ